MNKKKTLEKIKTLEKAKYVEFYCELNPAYQISEGVIKHLELGDRVKIVKNIIIYNKLPKNLKFNPIIQFCMFGESGAFQNEYLKNKN